MGVGLLFVFAAWVLRFSFGYPICRTDEANWIDIARQLDRGVSWPVSGPAFIEAARWIARQFDAAHTSAIPWLGVLGVFFAVCALVWGYRKFNLSSPMVVLTALALSSYFWAPLMEARPQQWGQILVFLGVICGWQWLHRKGGWAFFLIVPSVTITHILSHAILAFLCGMLVIADYVEKRPLTKRHLGLLLAVLMSMGIYLWPRGPYAAMLNDLEHNQMKRLLVSGPYAAVLFLLGIAVFIWGQRKWHWRPSWTDAVATGLVRRSTAAGLSVVSLVFTALVMQAYLLPADAWLPYGGSWLRFLFFQSGNLIFAGLFVVGIHRLVAGLQSKQLDANMGRLLIWVLVALSLLSVLSIIVSWWLLHTNWFLRILNYGIFFAAIVAALGIGRVAKSWPAIAKYALLGIGVVASILAVLRPPQLLGC